MGCPTLVYRSYSSSTQCQSIFQWSGTQWFLCQYIIPWFYRGNRNFRCRRWNCRADDKTLTIITAVTAGNTQGKVRNGGKSGICPRKMTYVQGFIWLCTSHLAWHRMQEGQTQSWSCIVMLYYLVFLSNSALKPTDTFPEQCSFLEHLYPTEGLQSRGVTLTLAATEVWASFCQRAAGDDQCNKLLHWGIFCSFMSMGKMHQNEKTTNKSRLTIMVRMCLSV